MISTSEPPIRRAPAAGTRRSRPGNAPAQVFALALKLLDQVPRGRRRLALALGLAVLATGCAVALMGVSAWLLSRAAEHPPVMYLTAAAVGVRTFGIGRGLFRYLERLVGHDVALRMQSALRMTAYDRLSRTTLLGRTRGDLLVRVTADVEAIVELIVRVVLPFCSATVVIVGTSIMLTMFSPPFSAVLLATSLLAGVVVPWLAQRWSRRADLRAVPTRGELGDQVRQMTRTATDLVAFGVEQRATQTLARVDGELRSIQARSAWIRGVAEGAQLVATGVAVAAAIMVGGPAVASGDLLGRNLAVLALVPLALHEVYADFSKAAQTLTRARVALGRVSDLLSAEPVGCGDRVVGDASPGDAAGLRLVGVSAGWPDAAPLLGGIQLTVNPGESVALVGASGLGKTTLAATILGLIPAVAGELWVPSRVGYLAQDAHIFATSLNENVRIGNKDATEDEVRRAMARAGLRLDQERLVGEDGATLSGGEAQRVALARVLVAATPPELVILDEPTEHLDHETAAALLDDLFTSLGDAALLVITHDPDLMARCDRVVALDEWATAPEPR